MPAFTYLEPDLPPGEQRRPVEYEQAGLELLGQPDADNALDQVLTFARWALGHLRHHRTAASLGGVGLFEAFLEAAGIAPAVAQPHPPPLPAHPEALQRLMERLGATGASGSTALPLIAATR